MSRRLQLFARWSLLFHDGPNDSGLRHDRIVPRHAVRAVAIIGGGLAGLAAAVAAVERGLPRRTVRARPALGGRAGSFVDSANRRDGSTTASTSRWAAAREFLDFCRRTGIDDCFDRTDRLHFIGPEGRGTILPPAAGCPPLHLLPGLAAAFVFVVERALGDRPPCKVGASSAMISQDATQIAGGQQPR